MTGGRDTTSVGASSLAKKFYTTVSIGDAAPHTVLLDGRAIRTPKKRVVELPVRALADAVADEWSAQNKVIDPHTMPLTRFVNSAIDVVADNTGAIVSDITAYAGNDLVCYRAHEPRELVAAEAKHWDPVLDWAREELHARFICAEGVTPVAQPSAATERIAQALAAYNAFELAGLHVLTTMTGSALLPLALAHDALSAEDVWLAAHVDENHQIAIWGQDSEAMKRRQNHRVEFDAAARLLQLVR